MYNLNKESLLKDLVEDRFEVSEKEISRLNLVYKRLDYLLEKLELLKLEIILLELLTISYTHTHLRTVVKLERKHF